LRSAKGADDHYDEFVERLADGISDAGERQFRMRQIVVGMATAYEAMLFLKHSTHEAADAFIASRLERVLNRAFGSLPFRTNFDAIVKRSRLSGGNANASISLPG